MRSILLAILFFILGASITCAQISVNGSIKSRYIWRGIDLGNSPNFQPSITYKLGDLTAGIAGAYGFPDTGITYAENDFWISYSVPLSSGVLSLLCTDLYFPSYGAKFFNTKGDGTGGHTVEVGLQYAGPESFPLITRAYLDVHNDPDNSSYFEFEYPFTVDSVALSAIVGIAGNKSFIYRTNGVDVINIGFSATKFIPVSANYQLQISTSFIVNPRMEQSYFVLGIGF